MRAYADGWGASSMRIASWSAMLIRAVKPVHVKHAFLLLVLALAAWAFLPSHKTDDLASLKHRRTLNPNAKYVVRMSPANYIPGTVPQNVGQPLQGFNKVADRFERLFPDTAIQFVEVP